MLLVNHRFCPVISISVEKLIVVYLQEFISLFPLYPASCPSDNQWGAKNMCIPLYIDTSTIHSSLGVFSPNYRFLSLICTRTLTFSVT